MLGGHDDEFKCFVEKHPNIPVLPGMVTSQGYLCLGCEKAFGTHDKFVKHTLAKKDICKRFQIVPIIRVGNLGYLACSIVNPDALKGLTDEEVISFERCFNNGIVSNKGSTPSLRKTMFRLVNKGN